MTRSLVLGGASRRWRLSFFLAAMSFLSSCAGSPHSNGLRDPHLIQNVPFFPQEMYQCGPASLAGVLNYWGIEENPEEIASEIYSKSARGTLNIDMAWYAEKKGLKAHFYQGSMEDLKNRIDSWFPLIVMVDYGFGMVQQNHFMVVVGYYENGIIANSGGNRLKTISLKDFIKSWKRTKFWTLWITPRS